MVGQDHKLENLDRLFGKALQELRERQGLSQENLRFDSGYHLTYISLLERGLRNPSLQTIFNLAKALQVRPSELVQRVEEKLVD